MIIGHKKNINFLDNLVSSGSLNQVFIFHGPESVGKKTIAKSLAKKIIGREISEADPNFFLLESQEKEIKMDEMREFTRSMSFVSSNFPSVFIIDEAEKLNKSSQNAILKSLEELGENKFIFLITNEISKLLPTVVSRCQKFKFDLVSDVEMEELYVSNKDKEEVLRFWSAGRPGVAKKILEDEEEIEKIKESYLNFKTLFKGNLQEKLSLADKISKENKDIYYQMEIWINFLRKALLGQGGKISISSKKAFILLNEIIKSMNILRTTQANKRLVLEDLFLKF